jgi:hypothetical protein
MRIEMFEAKAFGALIRIYSLFKSERLSVNIKLTLYKTLIRSVMTYACPAWELGAEPAKQGSPYHWKFSKVYTISRFAHGVQPSICIRLYEYNKIMQATSSSHTKL